MTIEYDKKLEVKAICKHKELSIKLLCNYKTIMQFMHGKSESLWKDSSITIIISPFLIYVTSLYMNIERYRM